MDITSTTGWETWGAIQTDVAIRFCSLAPAGRGNKSPITLNRTPTLLQLLRVIKGAKLPQLRNCPSLEVNGGLTNYITARGYLDFTERGRTLGNGIGFWVNKP